MFDVRVVAFAGGSTRTLQALQDLFGLDREAAQRLVDNVPLVVRRGAPANEAQNYVEVLRGIGAQVALERPDGVPLTAAAEQAQQASPPPGPRKPPPPPQAKVPPPPGKPAARVKVAPPPPREAEPALRPSSRQRTADLEFDLATPGGGRDEAVSADDAEPQSSVKPIKSTNKRRNDIEFSADDTGRLELEVDDVRPQKRTEDKAEAPTTTKGEPTRPPAAVSGQQTTSADPRPMSRAAVVERPGIVDAAPYSQRRQRALLRMLGAVLVFAAGIWLDSSIIYGNANPLSVIVHGSAIYQFGVGLRGMLP